MDLTDRVLKERYKITERIEAGGMAVVYKGTDLLLVRTVAIKVLKDVFTRDKGVLERFYREARAAAGLSHPNIVSIYDIGREENLYFIVMEYMSNGTLEDLMKRKKEIPFSEVIKYGVQIARALDYSHQKRVIHRDIKPQNIMLTEENQLKVVDFGIARAVDAHDITQDGVIMGSAYYFSPEQASGKTATNTSDIYSLGVLLYHMATGRKPFEGKSLGELANKHLKEIPLDPCKLNPAIPMEFERIILKAMEKNPGNRYQSAMDLLLSLQTCISLFDEIDFEDDNFVKDDIKETVSPAPDEISEAEFFPEEYEKQLQEEYETGRFDEDEIIFTLDDLKGKEKVEKRFRLWAGIILITIALIGIILGVIWALSHKKPKEVFVSVPDIKGRQESQARTILEKWSLSIGNVNSVYNYDHPAGAIISQEPERGASVKKGSKISVLVSLGPAKVTVPYLIHLSLSEAQLKTTQKGLLLSISKEEYQEGLQSDYIISQEPPAGTEIEGKSSIYVVISKAKDGINGGVIIPDLSGLNKAEAEDTLSLKSLHLVILKSIPHKNIKKGLIISQEPLAGTFVENNSTVKVVLSSGPPVDKTLKTVIVPELLAKTLGEAKNITKELDLTIEVQSDEGKISDNMIVYLQTPVAGKKINKNEKIVVKVKTKVVIVEVPDVRGKLLMDAKNALRNKGLLVGYVRDITSPDVVPGTVIQQDPLPKTALPTGSTISLVVVKAIDNTLVSVPVLIGKNLTDAKSLIEKEGLILGQIILQSSEDQSDIILSQEPSPGISVKRGTEVNIIVSK
ncbi:MAG TPA: Stk1 family PASTA domain-containing Ser/Thr kinase [Candidatus Eremiobacteraeota bacterium]|mgnify:CR=1 FL=1|nr:MAG: Serine/threonine-protein kinase PrkC [bacterium ADurb.Bin363]HPZ08505.1 Stk1 family PASTA domain-containing Ser/Thr kinase [Candidatus Eremiobacteraeota bacterium]